MQNNLFLPATTILHLFNLEITLNTVYILSFDDFVVPEPSRKWKNEYYFSDRLLKSLIDFFIFLRYFNNGTCKK